MKKLRIYLDTSVINFLFAEDAPDFRRVTEEFFSRHATKYEMFTSEVLLVEVDADPNPAHRNLLRQVLQAQPIALLPEDRRGEIERMAGFYLAERIIPQGKLDDAFHVGYATVFEMDILLSWNFKHLANLRREARIVAVNVREGYRHPLRIVSPLEVEDEYEN